MFIIFFYLAINLSNIAKAEEYNIIFDEIFINNIEIDTLYNSRVLLGKEDSLRIIFSLRDNSNKKIYSKTFFYHLYTKDSSIYKKTNTPIFQISNLTEKDWFLVVSANKSGNKIESEEYLLMVSNTKKNIFSEMLAVFENERLLDSIWRYKAQHPIIYKIKQNENTLYTIIYSLSGIIILILLFFLSKHFKKKREEAMFKSKYDNLKGDYDKVVEENENLKKMLDHFKNQSTLLVNEKDDLEQHINKLTVKKDELIELQSQKDELFAVVIHDIKNPVSVIKSLVELLTSYDLTATQQQEIIKDIAKTTTRIIALSQEVTKVLSLDQNVIQLDSFECNIRDIINDVLHRNTVKAKAKKQSLGKNEIGDIPHIVVDIQKVDEILDNLISNAIKFTQKGGTISIESSYKNNEFTISVIDNGLGMSENDLKAIFQRGARLSTHPTAGEETTGMGLWIVKRLVETLGGNIHVQSHQGVGSTFKIILPMKPPAKINDDF